MTMGRIADKMVWFGYVALSAIRLGRVAALVGVLIAPGRSLCADWFSSRYPKAARCWLCSRSSAFWTRCKWACSPPDIPPSSARCNARSSSSQALRMDRFSLAECRLPRLHPWGA